MKVMLSLALTVLFTATAMSQGLSRISMDKGQRFIATLTPGFQSPTEKPIPRPFEIIATSEFEANVRFRAMDPNGSIKVDTTLRIVPKDASGGLVKLSVSTAMVVSTTKRKAKVAFEITSDAPVTVTTRRSWNGGGEEVHILPADHLGTTYRAIAMPSDVYGLSKLTWTPGYLAVIGTTDGTQVSLTSKLKLIDPNTAAELPANKTHTFAVDAGDVLLFEHVIDTMKVNTAEQDLTGTLITATQSIGVLSGHLKGAVGTTLRIQPPSGAFAAEAHFTRNNLAEMMPPITMADTMFVVTPFAYTPVRTGWKHLDSAEGMILGDIVKFVATENTTFIYKQRQGDLNRKLLGVIQAGETISDSALFESATYWSSKPVLAAQFGRSYSKYLPVNGAKGSPANVQGHPTVEAGMPAMSMVVPEDRWVTSAVWAADPSLDNFCSIVFRTGDAASITWNGRPLTEFAGVKEITNTPYSQLTWIVATEMNLVRAIEDDVRFSVLPQSSLDGLQQGRALAHPTGFDNPAPGRDTIIIADDMLPLDAASCGMREATATLSGPNGITTVFAAERTNYRLVLVDFTPGGKSATYRVEPIDASVSGSIVVRVVAASGEIAERRYSYDPQPAAITATALPSTLGINVPECFDVNIVNTGLETLVITELSLLKGGVLDVDADLPMSIDPAASKTVTCCATPTSVGVFKDTLIVKQLCYDMKVKEIAYTVTTPLIAVDDVMFGRVDPASQPITKNVEILNRTGGVKMMVSGFRWSEGASDPHFQYDTTGLGLPVMLEQGQSISLPVTYQPNGEEGTHTATIRVLSSSIGSDSLIRCTAESKTVSSVEEEPSGIDLHPVPVAIGGTLQAVLPPMSSVQVVDLQGRVIEEARVGGEGVLRIKILENVYTHGVYFLLVTSDGQHASYPWIVR